MDFTVILAKDSANGIGINNSLPWKNATDLQHFKTITTYTPVPNLTNMLIMGYNTYRSMKHIIKQNRKFLVLTSKHTKEVNELNFDKLFKALEYCKKQPDVYKVFVIGGAQLFREAFTSPYMKELYVTTINKTYTSDTFIEIPPHLLKPDNIQYISENDDSTYVKYICNQNGEAAYLKLLEETLLPQNYKLGRNGATYSVFSEKTLQFNLEYEFPLLTSKKMPFKMIFEELMFFIRGQTNTKILESKNIFIWSDNSSAEFLKSRNLEYPEGEIGPMYGFQWRNWGAVFPQKINGFDQFSKLLYDIKNDPNSRRLLLTTYNPTDVPRSVLAPCHGLTIQFYVKDNKYLSCHMYQRSADLFLGLPFNISSYALLTCIIAKYANLKPLSLVISLGDAHIYDAHVEQVYTQLSRNIYPFPIVNIKKELGSIDDIEKLEYSDIELVNYRSNDPIKADMIA